MTGASFAVLCVFALRICSEEFSAQRRKGPQSSQRSHFGVAMPPKFLDFPG